MLDTARQLMIAELDEGKDGSREIIDIPQLHPVLRAKFIGDLSIDRLICGAVSRQLELFLIQAGVRLIPWITGDVDDIILAYTQGQPLQEAFCLPGCCRFSGRRRMGRGYRHRNNKNEGRNRRILRRNNENSGFVTGK